MRTFLLVRIFLQASFLKSAWPARGTSPSSSCYCGFGGICQVDNGNHLVPENCSDCSRITGSLYRADCKTLATHCNRRTSATSPSSSPCKNGGTCIPVLGSFYCVCPPKYFETDCSKFDPYFSLERLSEPQVYYPLQTRGNRRRDIYVGVKDFGDDFTAEIIFKTIGTQYRLTEVDFDWTNIKTACWTRLSDHEDPTICESLPDHDMPTVVIPHRTIRNLTATDRLVYLKINGKRQIVGIMDTLEIILRNGNYPAFNQTYKLFSSSSELEILCNHVIRFSGCSAIRSDPLTLLKIQEVVLESIIYRDKKACHPIKIASQRWYRMTTLKLNEIEGTEGERSITFDSGQLQGGIHEIHFDYTIAVDPPHYGPDKFISNIGICWIDIYEGTLDVGLDVGFLRTVPCNTGFTLTAINLNTNYRMEDMSFTWSCNNSADARCKAKRTKGSVAYPGSGIGCGMKYQFTMTVVHPTRNQIQSKTTNVLFKRNVGGEFRFSCIKNCLPTAMNSTPIVLQVENKPWFPGTFEWVMTDSTGSSIYQDNVKIRSTPFGEFIFFDRIGTEAWEEKYTLSVSKGGAEAGFNVHIRRPPSTPTCAYVNTMPAKNEYTFDVYCEGDELGVFLLMEMSGHYPVVTTSTIATSTSGQFLGAEIFSTSILIQYSNFEGDNAVEHGYIENPFNFTKDMIANGRFFTEIESSIQSGDHTRTLHLLNTAFRRILIDAETGFPGVNGTSNVTKILLKYFTKVRYNKQLVRIQMAMNFINGLVLMDVEDDPVMAANSRHAYSVVMRKAIHILATAKERDLKEYFRSYNDTILVSIIEPAIRAMLKKDPYLSTIVDYTNSRKYQKLNRFNEEASVNLIDYINHLQHLYVHYTWPMGEPFTIIIDQDNIQFLLWSVIGTTGFIIEQYFQSEKKFQRIAIHRNTSVNNSGLYSESTSTALQMSIFTVDFFWWHRTKTFHTEILSMRLFDTRNRSIAPSYSNLLFAVTLEILPEYRHLINGSILEGNTTLPEDDDAIRRYRFDAAEGINRIYYEFIHCSSKFGCRVVITRHQPLSHDFPNESRATGHYITQRDGDNPVKYYVGVLPNEKEVPGQIVNFTLRFTTGMCKIWTDYKRMENCEFNRFNGNSMVGVVKHLSWIGMTVYQPIFSTIVNLKLNLTQEPTHNIYVLFVTLAMTVFFCLILIWVKWEESMDAQKRQLMNIEKISLHQNVPYIVGVYTGATVAHTTSTVALRLVGDNYGPAGLIRGSNMPTLKSGTNDWFQMYTRDPLGPIQEIHIWLDHAGCCPDWYCEKILVIDSTDPTYLYEFLVGKRLSVVKSSCDARMTVQYARRIGSFEDSIRTSGRYLWYTWRTEILNKHNLLSIFYKHPRALHTRTERLGLLWVHMFSALSGSMIFWIFYSTKQEDEKKNIDWYEYIWALLVTLAVAYTASSVVTFLFRATTIALIGTNLCFLNIFGLWSNQAVWHKWLGTTVFSVLVDLILIEPMKLLVFSLIMVYFLKTTDIEVNLIEADPPVSPRDRSIVPPSDHLIQLIEEGTKSSYKPLLTPRIKTIRAKRKRYKRLLLIGILIFILTAMLLLVFAYILPNIQVLTSYHVIKALNSLLSETNPALSQVWAKTRIFPYITNGFLPTINLPRWYNKRNVSEKLRNETFKFEKKELVIYRGLLPDKVSSILNLRLSQHRISKSSSFLSGSISPIFNETYPSLKLNFFERSADTRDYCEGWTDIAKCPESMKWLHKEESTTFFWNGLNWYPYSAYNRNLQWSKVISTAICVNLEQDNWIDSKTRTVIVEFNYINRYVKSVTSGGILLETFASGVVSSRIILQTIYIDQNLDFLRLLESIDDEFYNFIDPINKFFSIQIIPVAALFLIVIGVTCCGLTSLFNFFGKPVRELRRIVPLLFKFFTLALYVHLAWWYYSQVWRKAYIQGSANQQDLNELASLFMSLLFYANLKVPLVTGVCIVARLYRFPLKPKRRSHHARHISFAIGLQPIRQSNLSSTISSVIQKRISRVETKFAKLKTD